MCTAAAGLVLGVGSQLWSGLSQSSSLSAQARIAEESAQAQANVLLYNADQARKDSEQVTEQETDALRDLRIQQRQTFGSQAASAGASGTTLTGDFSNIAVGTGVMAQQDLAATRQNYASERSKYINEAQSNEYQAANALIQGANTAASYRSQSRNAVLGSLLTAGGTLASNWGAFSSSGSTSGTTTSSASSFTLGTPTTNTVFGLSYGDGLSLRARSRF